jgi:hypothetical protein
MVDNFNAFVGAASEFIRILSLVGRLKMIRSGNRRQHNPHERCEGVVDDDSVYHYNDNDHLYVDLRSGHEHPDMVVSRVLCRYNQSADFE